MNFFTHHFPHFSVFAWQLRENELYCAPYESPAATEARSGQNHYNKIAPQVNFNPTAQQILWTCCVLFSSLNNTFFSVLIIIFSNMNYFCYNYTNNFLIHTKNYFFIGPRIIFRGIAIFFSSLQCIAGLAVEGDWFECLTFESCANGGVLSKRMPRRNIVTERNERGFHLFSQNLREASSLYEGDDVFWPEDLIEETTKRLYYSYTILTLIAHFGKNDSLGPKLSARAFLGLFGGTSGEATLNYDETCKLLCAFVHK